MSWRKHAASSLRRAAPILENQQDPSARSGLAKTAGGSDPVDRALRHHFAIELEGGEFEDSGGDAPSHDGRRPLVAPRPPDRPRESAKPARKRRSSRASLRHRKSPDRVACDAPSPPRRRHEAAAQLGAGRPRTPTFCGRRLAQGSSARLNAGTIAPLGSRRQFVASLLETAAPAVHTDRNSAKKIT
jgi:hypothetical protein